MNEWCEYLEKKERKKRERVIGSVPKRGCWYQNKVPVVVPLRARVVVGAGREEGRKKWTNKTVCFTIVDYRTLASKVGPQ